MSIPLPALPAPYSVLTNGTLCYTAEQLRARDQEIVRRVLEQAAIVADARPYAGAAIRALEFHHE